MKVFLVGGAVRDRLLGLPVAEKDWVVLGSSPEEMAAHGYLPVGKDFPVFLHPTTKEEYALARTERKSGHGYAGFTFHTGSDVTLEDDLARRDLTVNAIAQDPQTGELFDPYGGQADLHNKILRHVSPAFAEDPLRILRVARFAARFAPFGFTVATETLELMSAMVQSGEADFLVAERVWHETLRALSQQKPSTYFETLRACGALKRTMPEIDALFGVPQTEQWHPEIDSGVHTMMVIDYAASINAAIEVRVACLLHDLGKAITPEHILPSHRGHESTGLPLVKQFCERLRVSSKMKELALAVTKDHLNVHRAFELRPATVLGLLERFRAFKDETFFENALTACLSDARGRLNFENCDYPSVPYLQGTAAIARAIQAKDVMSDKITGAKISSELKKARIAALSSYKATQLKQKEIRENAAEG